MISIINNQPNCACTDNRYRDWSDYYDICAKPGHIGWSHKCSCEYNTHVCTLYSVYRDLRYIHTSCSLEFLFHHWL